MGGRWMLIDGCFCWRCTGIYSYSCHVDVLRPKSSPGYPRHISLRHTVLNQPNPLASWPPRQKPIPQILIPVSPITSKPPMSSQRSLDTELESFRQQWLSDLRVRRPADSQTAPAPAPPPTKTEEPAAPSDDGSDPDHDSDGGILASALVSALDFYEAAMDKEAEGNMGDSVKLYRQAYRVNDRHHPPFPAPPFPPPPLPADTQPTMKARRQSRPPLPREASPPLGSNPRRPTRLRAASPDSPTVQLSRRAGTIAHGRRHHRLRRRSVSAIDAAGGTRRSYPQRGGGRGPGFGGG